jgi:putative flippase GtrA
LPQRTKRLEAIRACFHRVKNFLLQKKQFLLYCVIGFSGVMLDLAVYSVLVGTKLFHYQTANAISYGSGTMLSFILNARFNFRVTDKIALRLVCFFSVAFLGYSVSAGLLHVFIGVWGCNEYLSKLATLVVVVILQYNLNRLLSFRKIN